ncbi:hypothetical protein CBS115989_1252 [Aspergillus niger]|nr:hypothetical protein CBS115989_1252 [Aspergillus niger]KAI2829718.1 hypothetical protein CBS133816_4147 [Aspergillus niger]KAI2838118.1 hypothetical protein CBS11350_8332 [Aspergillus niger]KAI2858684.1 hypothetical protein CBS11232_2450 [Aspergillus niger]KAI2866257.1 hypothetical protein CBS12448_1365 [Aspergillus niger]
MDFSTSAELAAPDPLLILTLPLQSWSSRRRFGINDHQGQRGPGVILIETSLPPSDALKLRSSRPTSQLVHRSCSP